MAHVCSIIINKTKNIKIMKTKILLLAIAIQVSAFTFGQMIVNTCQVLLLTDNYNNPGLWTQVGTTTSILGSTFNFNNTIGGVYDRQYRFSGLNSFSSKYFIAQCKFRIISGNGPGHHILTLSSSRIDPVSYDASLSYAPTNNDAIIVDLTAMNPPTSSTSSQNPLSASNPWQYRLRYKIGTTLVTCPQSINALAKNTNTFIKLERAGIGGNDLKLSIFSDATYTTHIPGSPITWCNLPLDSIRPLRYVNHGVYTWAGGFRKLKGKIDNLNICQGLDVPLCPVICEDLDISAGADLVTCCAPAGTQLNCVVFGGTPASISWSPTTGLNNPNILNPISTTTGTYVVMITNNCNQVYTDTVTIISSGGGDLSCCRIGGTGIKPKAFPNPFSDNFSITIAEEKVATVVVSNLYGIVFETKTNASGTIQLGNNLKQGTYSITIIYTDGSKELINAIKL
jgi:hypothetical protein